MKREIAALVSGEKEIDEWLVPSGEQAIEVVTGIFFNDRKNIPSAIVYNDGALSQLPDDVAAVSYTHLVLMTMEVFTDRERLTIHGEGH